MKKKSSNIVWGNSMGKGERYLNRMNYRREM
jgi:hypothetical protein